MKIKKLTYFLLALSTLALCFFPVFYSPSIATAQTTCNLIELNKFQDKNSNRSLEILESCSKSLPDSAEKAEVLRRLAMISYDRIDSAAAFKSKTRSERLESIETRLQESLALGKTLKKSDIVSNANYSLAQIRNRELNRLIRTPIEMGQSSGIILQNVLEIQTQISATLQQFRDSNPDANKNSNSIPSQPLNSKVTTIPSRIESIQPQLYESRLLVDYLPKLYSILSTQSQAIEQDRENRLQDLKEQTPKGTIIPELQQTPAEVDLQKLEQTAIMWTQDLITTLTAIPIELQSITTSGPTFEPDSIGLNIYHATTLKRIKLVAEGVHQYESDRLLVNQKTNQKINLTSNKIPNQNQLSYKLLFPIELQTKLQTLYSNARKDAVNLLIQTINITRQTKSPDIDLQRRLKRDETQALNALAMFYEEEGNYDTAASFIDDRALLTADTLNSPELSGLLYGRAAHIKLQKIRNETQTTSQPKQSDRPKQDDRIAALNLSETAIKRIELVRGDLVSLSPDLQYNYRDSVEPLYRDNIELQLLQLNPDLKTVLERVESLKITEIHNYFREPCIEAKVELDQFITQNLPNSIALIYTIITNDRLEIITKLPNQAGLRRYQSTIDRKTLAVKTDRLKTILKSSNDTINNNDATTRAKSAEIYQLIFEAKDTITQTSLSDSLPDNTTLVMVLDGGLREIPMAALYDSKRKQFLIDRYAIAVSPGLKLFEPKTIQKPNILFSGQGKFPTGLQTLPGSKLELDQLNRSKVFSPKQVLTDAYPDRYKPLNLDNFRAFVADQPFNVVHLSTHANFSSQQEKTYIAMGDAKVTTEQFSDVLLQRNRQRSEAIELLILSACDTVAGDDRAALGLSGLAIRSGARSTFAALWTINDEVTADVILDFYQGVFKDQISKAQALRLAQLKIKAAEKPLSQWSPYVVVGNWL